MPDQFQKSPLAANIPNHQGWKKWHYLHAVLAGKSWSSTYGQQDSGGEVERSSSDPSDTIFKDEPFRLSKTGSLFADCPLHVQHIVVPTPPKFPKST
jgi:hypothetical protein